MNKVILIGRVASDPDVRYSQGENSRAIAKYRLAVDRRKANADGQREADFISCVAFDRQGEFAEKYLHKGTKIAVVGHIQTGSYQKQDGTKAYTTDVIVEEHEFVESKAASEQNAHKPVYEGQKGYDNYQPNNYRGNAPKANYDNPGGFKTEPNDGFMQIPDSVEATGLPWN